jgi:hypothetical protein
MEQPQNPNEPKKETFRTELETLINKYSQENMSDTPDFILADYLCICLGAFSRTVEKREKWHGRKLLKDTPDELLN